MAEKKTASTQDVVAAFAKAVGKNPEQFGTQEFENVDGEQSLVIVDLASGSICLQANGDNGAQRLLDSIEAGTLTFVDPAKEPKQNPVTGREQGPGYGGADVSTAKGVGDITKDTDGLSTGLRTGDDVWAELPRNDRGQVVIDENSNIVGAKESPLSGATQRGDESRPAKVAEKAPARDSDSSATSSSSATK